MARLLTEIADYDDLGSWGRASDGWPDIRGAHAYDMWVFANCVQSIPYGSYVLMGRSGEHGASESYVRVHAEYIDVLKVDFEAAGKPTPDESIVRRAQFGELRKDGLRERAPRWW